MRRLIEYLRSVDWTSVCGIAAALAAVVMLYATTQHFDNQALLLAIGKN